MLQRWQHQQLVETMFTDTLDNANLLVAVVAAAASVALS